MASNLPSALLVRRRSVTVCTASSQGVDEWRLKPIGSGTTLETLPRTRSS